MKKTKIELTPKEGYLLWRLIVKNNHSNEFTFALIKKMFSCFSREEKFKLMKKFEL